MNPYEILGVPRDAAADAIKAAYREKAKTLHPDGGGDAAAFQTLGAAHRILSDPEKRRRYDETGATDEVVDRTKAFALQKLHAVLGQLLAADGAIYRDLVEEARTLLRHEVSSAPQAKARIEQEIKKLETLRKRFKAKKGPDFIGEMIDGQVAYQRQVLSQIDGATQINGIALDMLADAEFQVEPQPVYQQQRNIFGGSPLGWSGNVLGR